MIKVNDIEIPALMGRRVKIVHRGRADTMRITREGYPLQDSFKVVYRGRVNGYNARVGWTREVNLNLAGIGEINLLEPGITFTVYKPRWWHNVLANLGLVARR